MSTINDIKKLPALYTEKARLEQSISQLERNITTLSKQAETDTAKAKEAYKNFDSIVKSFQQHSEAWWRGFYQKNSAETVNRKLADIDNKTRNEQARISEANKLDTPAVVKEIENLKNELNKTQQQRNDFAELSGYVARKAMCYNVCVYASPNGWCIKRFKKMDDWGLHLEPSGAGSSLYQYIFMITSPLAYTDLSNAVSDLPAMYGNILASQDWVRTVMQRYGLKSSDPARELNDRLSQARRNKQTAQQSIDSLNREKRSLQAMQALTGKGQDAFMRLDFDQQPMLLSYKSEYKTQITQNLAKHPHYSGLKMLCDGLTNSVFDYKKTENYVVTNRHRMEQAIENAPLQAQKEREETEKQLAMTRQMLNQTREAIRQLHANYESLLIEMTKNDPVSTFFYQGGDWINTCDDEGNSLAVERIKAKADERIKDQTGKRKQLKRIPVYEYLDLGGVEKPFLSDMEWQNDVDNAVNLIVRPLREDKGKNDAALWAASNLITAILLAMPIRRIHFTFIDFRTDGIYSKMLSQLNADRNLYTVIHDSTQLSEVKKLYNERTQNQEDITEVIVWTDCISDEVFHIKDALSGIMQNGARYGYYMIAVPLGSNGVSERAQKECDELQKAFNFRTVYAPGEDFKNGRDIFINKLEEYVKSGADTTRAAIILQPSMERAQNNVFDQQPIHIDQKGIVVPIGYDENNHQETFYEFHANTALPHTFLLGGSGSGKSFLLHNILLNAMLKYHAEDLEFYLMDFKMGAAEFRFYQDMPHVSHLLIDGADHQAVYEILNELDKKMEERGKTIADANAGNLANYNEQHPDKRIPYIVLVVDECHKLFESDTADRKMQEAINKTIANIVKEGRSQGVTLIFATQTFAGMEIPTEIKNEARNKYLMRVTTSDDANKLFDGGAVRNGSLSQGYAYHEATKAFMHIYDYRPFKEKAKQTILKKNKRPAGRNNFVFSGKDVYHMPDTGDRKERYPVAMVGKSVSVKREDIMIPLKKEDGSNVLITGINDELQAERVFFGAALSLAMQTYGGGKKVNVSIFDNPGDDDDRFDLREPMFNQLEQMDNVKILRSKKERLNEIARLSNIVKQENPQKEANVLMILAEEKMRRLLTEMVPQLQEPVTSNATGQESERTETDERRERFGFASRSSRIQPFATTGGVQREVSMQEQLLYLLKEGGESHVHIIMQVNQPANILADGDRVQRNDLRQWFANMVLLKCPAEVQNKLPIDNIRLDRLNDKADLLRAVYLDENGDTQTFTPYVMGNND